MCWTAIINQNHDYWEKFMYSHGKKPYGDELAEYEKEFFDSLLFHSKKAEKILDIGCGDGRMLRILKKSGVRAKLFGIDISRNVKTTEFNYKVGDTRKLPYKDNTFDVVYSLGTVEHFKETDKAINEHFRVLRNGGFCIITVPHLSILRFFGWLNYIRLKRYKLGNLQTVMGDNKTLKEMGRILEYEKFPLKNIKDYRLWCCGQILPFKKYLGWFELFLPKSWSSMIVCEVWK